MKRDLNYSFPRHLELWMIGDKLKYRVEEKELDSSKIEFLKSNKDFFKDILEKTRSKNIKVLPLAHNQKALWFLHKVNPENTSYNVSLAAEIKDPIVFHALENTLSLLIEKHQMLRTVFADLPGSESLACQIVFEKTNPVIEQINGSNLSDAQIRDLLHEKNRTPFNFEQGPLFTVVLVIKPDTSILCFNFNHIICDAISLRNLMNEFIRIYNSIVSNEHPQDINSDSDYDSYIFDQIDFLKSEKGDKQLNYWKSQLAGKPQILELPLKFKRPSIHRFKGSTLLFRIEGERYNLLRAIARERGVTFNVLLLSAFEFFVSVITRQSDFFVGLPAAGRTRTEFENIFGYFINLLPLGCSISAEKTFIDFLNENKTLVYESLENQEIPFPVIVENVSPKRDLSRTPIFQVIFNYLNKKSLGSLLNFLGDTETTLYTSWGDLLIKPYKIFDQQGQVDLTLEIADDDKNLICALKYNSDLFDSDTANEFKDEFLQITDLIIKDADFKPEWLSGEPIEIPAKPTLHINITGTFTVEPVKPFMEFWFDKIGVAPEISFPGYNQVFSQLLNPVSEFNTSKDGYNILLIRLEDWIKDKNSDNNVKDFDKNTEEFNSALSNSFNENKTGKYIIAFCPASPVFLKKSKLSARIHKAEKSILNSLILRSNVVALSSEELIKTYEVTDYYEELGEEAGHIPYTDKFLISLSTIIARKIQASFKSPYKAIAVDCDNTLWAGVVGEDGPSGVTIGRSEIVLQEFLVDQMNAGTLICLCSKNREEDVFEVFDINKQMILKKEHIAFHRINWNPKSDNLTQLAKEINIGLDSFVFIDDSPIECAEVRSNAPEVLTIQLPEGGFSVKQLQNSWIFDRLRITEEDRKRSEKYKEEAVRSSFRSSVNSYKDFISGLNLKIEIVPFKDENIPRISQLTFRTNQFNFTTLRRTENEIKNISDDRNFEGYQVSLSDRFGEYGLIGVIIVNKLTGYAVDTFLLSCRVLGKGVEHLIISFLGEKARLSKAGFLSLHFRKTDKNTPAGDFLLLNFGDIQKTDNEVQTFDIPVDRAVDFTFNPEGTALNQEVTEEKTTKVNSGQFEGKDKNDFYYMILDRYLSLENLVAELNKRTTNNSDAGTVSAKGSGQTEINVMSVWQQVLKNETFGNADNFFDIGGHSVLIPQIVIQLHKLFDIEINIVDIFQYPTVKDLAAYIEGTNISKSSYPSGSQNSENERSSGNDIAVIGMAGRFSGVSNLEEFWGAISAGEEKLSYYTREELLGKGVDEALIDNKDYVLANGNIESAEKFDSAFFGITPREADFMDPQHRVFLETCYEALDNSGYTSDKFPGEIGVFAGCGMNNYLVKNLFQHPGLLRSSGEFQTIINNNSDYLTTRVSYKLNLTGPSIDIQSACSTSLVAIHLACQSLIIKSCDISLAGGVFIQIPHAEGYMFEPGGIFSPDGHCRPFDSEADGTLFGEGSGVVVLKRLDDAIRDCDTISAVIKGSAINNDGSGKVGYMAPSVNGQIAVVKKAIAEANIPPDTVSYIETHGTGTKLGDPVEVKALSQIFKSSPDHGFYCALGSVKANIGHLDAAAGVAGVLKVVMMLKNKKLPPQLNFKNPNPELKLNDTPFYINASLTDWPADNGPRRAGVSSFGIGGTNAHCILEEYPEVIKTISADKFHLLPISAKTSGALKTLTQNISNHVLTSGQDIADISFTLQNGRNRYKHRTLLVYKKKAGNEYPIPMAQSDVSGLQELSDPSVVFMFTGQGSQYAGMAEELYYEFSAFRSIVDNANLYLKKNFNLDILKYILNGTDDLLQEEINQTSVAQPLLFTIQYAVARLLGDFGIRPDALIGHSIGEYTAAAISGIFEFEDALKLVAWRGKLMQEQKPGAMISVQLPYENVLPFVSDKVNLSLRNAPEINVLSGDFKDIAEVYDRLVVDYPEIHLSKLKTSHAFHSYMMEPVLQPFSQVLETVKFGESKIPVISNKSGSWAGPGELSVAGYWTDQIKSTVNFVDGVNELLKKGNSCFIEVGPGITLATLLSQFDSAGKKIRITSTLRHPKKKLSDSSVFLKAVAQAWVCGVNIDWSMYYRSEKRLRVPLPAYPFESERHWVDPVTSFNYFTEVKGSTGISGSESYVTDPVRNDHSESSLTFHSRPTMDNKYIAPSSNSEIELVNIWEGLLGISGIGLEDDFFYLGGHSLLASQVINRISEKFHIWLPLESLFSTPTISGLISKIESEIPSAEDEPVIAVLAANDRLPVSYDQKHLWILNQIDRNNPSYNIPFTYRLKGKLDVGVFAKSLKLLFERHAILRSSVKSEDGEPYCIIHEYKNSIKYLDYSSLSTKEAEIKLQDYFTRESRGFFDTKEGPLYRLYMVKIRDDEYVFHMTVQHMVFDGWSWGIFAGELRQIYNDLLNNREISLNPLQYQYYDIANWQKSIVTKDTYRDSIVFWKKQLKDHPSEINFPFDRARSKTLSGFGGREAFKLNADFSARIRALSQKENSTTFMTLLAAFGLLLNKYSGDDDICIGAPTANRGISAFEKIIGLFVNTIIMRLRFTDSMSFSELLQTTRLTTLDALAHNDLPFERLVEILQPERKLNVNPISQILFAYQNTPRPPLDLEGIVPERILIKDTVSPLDITFYAWESDGCIEGELEFNSDLFDRDTIARLKENFIYLLDVVLENPGQRISEISIISDKERKKLDGFNSTKVSVPDCLAQSFFESQVISAPSKTAIVSGLRRVTYKELDDQANILANHLIHLGAVPGNAVGIYIERSAEMIISVLAILKAGCCYLPLDPAFPPERLSYMFEDSGAKVIITQKSLKDKSGIFANASFVIIDDKKSFTNNISLIRPLVKSDPQSLAYLLYTSGSTGKPKGVKVHHQAVVNLINSMSKSPGVNKNDILLAVVTLSFDMSVFEIFLPLSNGATIVIADSNDIRDGYSLIKLIEKFNITILQAAPSLYYILIASGWKGKANLRALCGGEALTTGIVKNILTRVGELWNCYGPTETTVFSTYTQITDPADKIHIGKPIENTSIYILDKYNKLLPAGLPGEIAIGGLGVAKGYINQPSLTAEKFIQLDDGKVIYKTGDRGRFLKDGNIELFGRIDNQVKIRGIRIEPSEIEVVLSKIEGINEPVVKLQKFSENDERLVAFLNVSDRFHFDARNINNQLKEKLPLYMIPAAYKIMKVFPRTSNGKIDRKALVFDIEEHGGNGGGHIKNMTASEKIIHEIWCDTLKSGDISVTDNFFDAGGNSLLAISVFSKMETALGSKLDLRTFFDSPRIRDLAENFDIEKQKNVDNKSFKKENVFSKIIKGEI